MKIYKQAEGFGEFEVIAGIIVISIIWMVGSCSLDWVKSYKESRVGAYVHKRKPELDPNDISGEHGGYQMEQ